MKKLISAIFAIVMVLSLAFIGDTISSNGNLSVNAQTSVTRKTTRGGKYVWVKTKNGTKKVWRASWRTGRKIGHGTKTITVKTYRKTKHGVRKVFHKVKRAVS